MEHLQTRLELRGLRPARAHVLGRAGYAGIGRVDVHLERRGHLAADDRALIEVDVLQRVDHARDVVQIAGGRVAIDPGLGVDHVHGRPGRAEIHARAPGLHVVLRSLPVQDEVPRGSRHRVLDQRAREDQPPLRGQCGPGLGHVLDSARGRIRKPDGLQHVERGVVNANDVGVGQRLVSPADHARVHGSQVVGQRTSAGGPPRRARPAAHHLVLDAAHNIPPAETTSAGCTETGGFGKERPRAGVTDRKILDLLSPLRFAFPHIAR